ncbi:MAG: hypothetical protein V1733_09225, partial [bacterium]
MSEPILMALVQLFAIVAASGRLAGQKSARTIVSSFLKQHLSSHELEEYLKLFDELLFFHEPVEGAPETGETAGKIREICRKVNKGLQQRDKVIVLVKFLEFLEEEHQAPGTSVISITNQEEGYLRIVADTFNLSDGEFRNARAFILDPDGSELDRDQLLVIDSTPHPEDPKHMFSDHLNGRILILYLSSIHSFICRYCGSDDL